MCAYWEPLGGLLEESAIILPWELRSCSFPPKPSSTSDNEKGSSYLKFLHTTLPAFSAYSPINSGHYLFSGGGECNLKTRSQVIACTIDMSIPIEKSMELLA